MTTVIVPMDVEAEITGWLRSKGVKAKTKLPIERAPGMIRVTRAGGEPGPDYLLDRPDLFVEVWGEDQADSFDRAVNLFALFVLMAKTGGPENLRVRSVAPSPPVTLQDDYAPELHRHVFNVSLVCTMGQMEV